MDLGGGWYDSDELMDEVSRMVSANETLRNIARDASCHIYTEDFATVYGDNRFIAVFPTKEGNSVIHLKDAGTYRNLLTNEVFESTDKTEVELKKNEFVFLVKE